MKTYLLEKRKQSVSYIVNVNFDQSVVPQVENLVQYLVVS